jgi:hypothetical protein
MWSETVFLKDHCGIQAVISLKILEFTGKSGSS